MLLKYFDFIQSSRLVDIEVTTLSSTISPASVLKCVYSETVIMLSDRRFWLETCVELSKVLSLLQSVRWWSFFFFFLFQSFHSHSQCFSVVMNPPDCPRPRDQDVWLAVPPDLPDDSLPLLQAPGLLQLLDWRKHVHAPQSAIRLTATIAHGDLGHVLPLSFLVVLVVLRHALLLLVLFAGLFQLPPFRRWRRLFEASASVGGACDADHHEAQRHQQAKANAHHEVEGEALWICCLGRETHRTW